LTGGTVDFGLVVGAKGFHIGAGVYVEMRSVDNDLAFAHYTDEGFVVTLRSQTFTGKVGLEVTPIEAEAEGVLHLHANTVAHDDARDHLVAVPLADEEPDAVVVGETGGVEDRVDAAVEMKTVAALGEPALVEDAGVGMDEVGGPLTLDDV